MRKHLRLINNFQSDQKITISRVISTAFTFFSYFHGCPMSINVAIVACLCKQSVDICPKKPQSICTLVTRGTLFCCQMWIHLFLSAQPANMWPLSGIFLPAHCLSFWNRGSEICRPRILYEPSPRERFFGVLQSSFCFSQILCYEADKSQILVRNPQDSRVHTQSAFCIFKQHAYIYSL